MKNARLYNLVLGIIHVIFYMTINILVLNDHILLNSWSRR